MVTLIAQWYKPVMEFLGTIHDLSLQYASVAFAIIDIDQCPAVVSHLGIAAQPGIVVYWRKKQAAVLSGLNAFHNTTELENILRFELEQRGAKKGAPVPKPDIQGIVQQAVHLSRVNASPTEPGQPTSAPSTLPTLRLRNQSSDSAPASGLSGEPGVAALPATSERTFQYLPNRQYELFATTANMKVIETKMKELGRGKMTPEDETLLSGLVAVLADDSRYSSSNFEDGQLEWLGRVLEEWPVAEAYAGMDLMRLAVLHPIGRASFLRSPALLSSLIEKAHSAPFAYQFMTFKMLANLFASRVAKQMILDLFEKILSLTQHLLLASSPTLSSSSSTHKSSSETAHTHQPGPTTPATPSNGLNKNLQLTITAVLLNYATFFLLERITDDIFPPTPLMNVISLLFQAHSAPIPASQAVSSAASPQTSTAPAVAPLLSEDALFRALIAIGTLALHSPLARPLIASLIHNHTQYFRNLESSQSLNGAPLSAHASVALNELLSLFPSDA